MLFLDFGKLLFGKSLDCSVFDGPMGNVNVKDGTEGVVGDGVQLLLLMFWDELLPVL